MTGVSRTRRVGQSERVRLPRPEYCVRNFNVLFSPSYSHLPSNEVCLMLARQLQTSYTNTLLHRSVLASSRATTLGFKRNYARSRYPERNPGVGRSRDNPERLLNNRRTQDDTQQQQEEGAFWSPFRQEQQPSVEDSPLWESSQRPPSSNPQEGLQKLLLENNTLVVTRYVC